MSGIVNKLKSVISSDKAETTPQNATDVPAVNVDNSDGAMDSAVIDDNVEPTEPTGTHKKRLSSDHGLDASTHKPSQFAHKLGAAEIAHEGRNDHQKRHGSISGIDHYGSGK